LTRAAEAVPAVRASVITATDAAASVGRSRDRKAEFCMLVILCGLEVWVAPAGGDQAIEHHHPV